MIFFLVKYNVIALLVTIFKVETTWNLDCFKPSLYVDSYVTTNPLEIDLQLRVSFPCCLGRPIKTYTCPNVADSSCSLNKPGSRAREITSQYHRAPHLSGGVTTK